MNRLSKLIGQSLVFALLALSAQSSFCAEGDNKEAAATTEASAAPAAPAEAPASAPESAPVDAAAQQPSAEASAPAADQNSSAAPEAAPEASAAQGETAQETPEAATTEEATPASTETTTTEEKKETKATKKKGKRKGRKVSKKGSKKHHHQNKSHVIKADSCQHDRFNEALKLKNETCGSNDSCAPVMGTSEAPVVDNNANGCAPCSMAGAAATVNTAPETNAAPAQAAA